MNAFEREAIREAVKEASERGKHYRETRSLPKGMVANDPESASWYARVERDAADIFVDVLEASLRRRGAWIVFLE